MVQNTKYWRRSKTTVTDCFGHQRIFHFDVYFLFLSFSAEETEKTSFKCKEIVTFRILNFDLLSLFPEICWSYWVCYTERLFYSFLGMKKSWRQYVSAGFYLFYLAFITTEATKLLIKLAFLLVSINSCLCLYS